MKTANPKLCFGAPLLLAAFLLSAGALRLAGDGLPLALDVADDGRQLKLLVRQSDVGAVCELWCYEGGPFHYGKASRTSDGKVVFVHKSGGMTATTTFTPQGSARVLMDIVVEGPLNELKTVNLMGPCMQFWHSEAFKRESNLLDFVKRCFLYTMRGPVGMLDTARGLMSGFKPDAPENNPPWTQWYVPLGFAHPGDIWAFGASGDRPLYGVVGVASKDGKWLSAIGCSRAKNVGQGWHDCIHHVPQMQMYLDEKNSRIVHRTILYVMPNDKSRLLESFRQDFPELEKDQQLRVSAGKDGTLRVSSRLQKAPVIDLSLAIRGEGSQRVNWESSPWGGLVRNAPGWRMWANPQGEAVDFAVSLKKDGGLSNVEAELLGEGWKQDSALAGEPVLARRSADGAWIATMMWERGEAGRAGSGVPVAGERRAETISVRGQLYLNKDDAGTVRNRWTAASADWQHAVPYRMPVEESRASRRVVTFAPNVEDDMTYGLTIVPPWEEGGTLHVNFPEHLEHGLVGHTILRHYDKRANPWKISADGRSASYEVESLELPGVRVQASAVSEGDRARLWLKITNGGGKTLERVKPLLCFWYGKLVGFPGKLSDNFQHTYVMKDGKLVTLANIPTENPAATAKVAYVRGCSQHDCDKFARGRGGLIESDIDRALVVVTARDGKRKAILTFTPGKSILSNAVIPCAHADPYLGTLEAGKSVEATGEILFTEMPLEEAVAALWNQETGRNRSASSIR